MVNPRRFTPALVFVSLLAATVAGVLAARTHDAKRDAERQAERADRAEAAVRTVMGTTVGRLEDLSGALEQSPALRVRGFKALGERLLDERTLLGTAYIVRVPGEERARFERAHGRQIVDVGPSGRLREARRSSAYFVATHIASRGGAQPVGQAINVGSSPVREAAMSAAARSGRATRSGPIAVAGIRRLGVTVYAPVFAQSGRIHGFVSGTYDANRLSDAIEEVLGSPAFRLSDAGVPLDAADGRLHDPVTRSVAVAGRPFTLRIGKERAAGIPSAAWVGLVGGLLTVLVTGLSLLAVRRERYALRLVDRRLEERDAAQAMARTGSFEWDLDSGEGTWSPEMWSIFGREPQATAPAPTEYIGWIHPDDRDTVVAGLRALGAGEGDGHLDFRLFRPGGELAQIHGIARVVRDRHGRAVRARGTLQDVTEARRAEHALRRSERRYRALTQNAPVGIYEADATGRVLFANERWCELAGLRLEQALGAGAADAVHPDDRERVIAAWGRQAADDAELELQYRFRRPDGSVSWVSGRTVALRDEHGTLIGYIGSAADITAIHEANRARVEAERRFANAFEEAPIGMALVAPDGAFLRVNGALAEILGYSHAELLTLTFQDITHPEDLDADLELLRQTIAGERRTYQLEKRYLRSDGDVVWALLSVSLIRDADGEPLYFVSQVEDVTERRAAQEALLDAEERFRSAFDEAPIGMAMTSLDGRVLRVNRALCEITGYSRDQLEAEGLDSITHPDDLTDDEAGRAEKRYVHASGHLVTVDLSVTVVRDGDGRPVHLLSQVQDITERKRFEGQLQYLADHDSLTGLFNRRRFEEELTRELATAERYGTSGAVLAIDLDNFKYINDSLGHSVGDELITRVGNALRGRLRRSDVLARLGGDEFAVILPRSDEAEAQDVAEELLEAVRGVDLAELGGRGGGTVSASIGIAMFDGAAELTAEELLVDADIAMYDAKEAGRARAVVYDGGEDRQERMRARMTWADRVRDALSSDGFVLHAQPVMPLSGPAACRSELLLRMLGENGDLILPASFLHVAERFDLVQEIDRWVVSQAIRVLAGQQAAGEEIVLGVNLSAKSITDPGLPEHIACELREHGADGRGLCFEVTETAAIVNVDRAKHFARRVNELGCELALDDFGAGFASFYYLKHLAFDLLKIDGEFVTDLATSVTNQLVVKSVVDIARGLGKRTIAEFVSDEETLELLRGMGVDFAQGFYIAPPAPLPPLPHLERA